MPRISVVVPVYNVEAYLLDCLESIAQQTVRDLEVIVVDDGSDDSSAAIAQAFIEGDARFRLVQQDNCGLGHARNVGAALATGEFLSFVDSDDLLPRRAYELLLQALESGSDFATGNVYRFSSLGIRQSPMFESAFRESRQATHVSEFPELLNDRIAPNKLWRRSFWDRHQFRFPEGVLFEDGYVAIPAHVLATSVDVVSDPCYLWRLREGNDLSITQRRTELAAITDRARAVDHVARFLASRGERRLKRLYDEACAAQDFRYSLQVLDEADEGYRTLFLNLVNDFFDRAHRRVFQQLPAIDRLKYHLVRRRLMPELLEVLKFEKSGEHKRTSIVQRRGRFYGDYPYRTDKRLKIPASVYRLDKELRLAAQIDDVWWAGTTLQIEGQAYIRMLNLPDPGSSELVLRLHEGRHGRRVIDLPVERVERPDVTAAMGDGVYNYDWSGFRTQIPADALRKRMGSWRPTTWRLGVVVTKAGISRGRRVNSTAPGRAQRPDVLGIDGVRLVPTSPTGRFLVEVDTMPAVVEGWRLDGEVLQVEGRLSSNEVDPTHARVVVGRRESPSLNYPVSLSPAGASWSLLAGIPLADLVGALEVADRDSHAKGHGNGVVWQVGIVPAAEQPPIQFAAGDAMTECWASIGKREVLLTWNRQGRLELVERNFRPVVMSARWGDDHRLELQGVYRGPSGQELDLVVKASTRVEEHTFAVRRTGQRFVADLTPAAVTTLAGTLPLSEGSWQLFIREVGTDEPLARIAVDRGLLASLPLTHLVGAKDFSVHDVEDDSLGLDVGPDLLPDERGRHHQTRLQKVDFPAFLRRGVRDAVLFESYGARQFSDSPRAICEELARRDTGLEMLWAVSDGQMELPEGVVPVRRWGRDWYEASARSRYVVTCVYRPLESWLRPPEGQVVVQTWHGAPFKKIGFDSDRVARLAGRSYHERLLQETSRWTHLISPNPPSTPILRSAFRYQGSVLETGYPRVDILHRPDRAEVAARVRSLLGLPEDKTVVLYAPTYRDDQEYRRNQFRLDLHLDLHRAARKLGDDHVLLVRRHQKIIDAFPRDIGDFTHDVSLYPDVNELLLVTDVLVSDYSSLMFDFANTGRPMVFFTYDLEEYRDELRGFYFDVERAPGPLLRTSDEVVEAIANAAEIRAAYDEQYAAFVGDFCVFDDGHAAARVVDRAFAEHLPDHT